MPELVDYPSCQLPVRIGTGRVRTGTKLISAERRGLWQWERHEWMLVG